MAQKGAPELYPVELREEIDKMNRSGKPPPLADTREEDYQTILAEIRELPDFTGAVTNSKCKIVHSSR